jgi:hypothetical protein
MAAVGITRSQPYEYKPALRCENFFLKALVDLTKFCRRVCRDGGCTGLFANSLTTDNSPSISK